MARCRFQPWVGERYGTRPARLLVVGESHYGHAHEDSPELTRNTIEGWRSGDINLRYYTNLACLLAGTTAGGLDRTTALSDIAFYNYVQVLLAVDNMQQPNDADWASAQEPFLDVVGELDPTHILVTSYRAYEQMPDPLARGGEMLGGKPLLVCEYPTRSGKALTIAIPHISRTPIANWVHVVEEFRQMPLAR